MSVPAGTSTGSFQLARGNATNTSASVMLTVEPARRPMSPKEKARIAAIADAVYGYTRAIRALNRTTVTTAEIAKALNIAEPDVLRAVALLTSKGVKLAA